MDNLHELIKKITNKIYKVADEEADFDESRPQYHFHAPAQWMDDPNGVIYCNGYYHMMYSLNPDTDKYRAGMVYKTGSSIWKPSDPDWTGGITVWGHARSKDLIHWEHLPVALYPETNNGEYYIWFGCTAINDENEPVAIYTSIGYEDRNPTDSAIQHIWFGSSDLIDWKPGEDANPIMTEKLHKGKKIWEWRDPFLFRQSGKTYLILGGKQDESDGGKAVVLLYQAEDKRYTKWEYKGILFEHPRKTLRSCECPNIVQLGSKWVLFVSPHGPVEYYVGDLDAEHCKFVWSSKGIVDASTHFYATNVIEDDQHRHLLWGAIEGFSNTRGWNGVNSLPREISVSDDGKLIQKIPKELDTLLSDESIIVKDSNALERGTLKITIEVSHNPKGVITLGKNVLKIQDNSLEVDGKNLSLGDRVKHCIEIYADISVAEIFIDEMQSYTQILDPIYKGAKICTEGDGISVRYQEVKTDNLFTRYPM